VPSTRSNAGAPTNVAITGIAAANGKVTFKVKR
jgi:hypothetical protein